MSRVLGLIAGRSPPVSPRATPRRSNPVSLRSFSFEKGALTSSRPVFVQSISVSVHPILSSRQHNFKFQRWNSSEPTKQPSDSSSPGTKIECTQIGGIQICEVVEQKTTNSGQSKSNADREQNNSSQQDSESKSDNNNENNDNNNNNDSNANSKERPMHWAHISNIISLGALVVPDPLWLRTGLILSGLISLYSNITVVKIKVFIWWGLVFLFVNVARLLLILSEKDVQFNEEEQQLFDILSSFYSPAEFKRLLKSAHQEEFPAGTELIREGETINQVYIIVDGRCKVEENEDEILFDKLQQLKTNKSAAEHSKSSSEPKPPKKRFIANLKGGHLVGLVSWVPGSNSLASTTVTVEEPVRCYVWRKEDLQKLFLSYPSLAVGWNGLVNHDLLKRLKEVKSLSTENQYKLLLYGILSDGTVSKKERAAVEMYRDTYHITPEAHLRALEAHGWTDEDWKRGSLRVGWFEKATSAINPLLVSFGSSNQQTAQSSETQATLTAPTSVNPPLVPTQPVPASGAALSPFQQVPSPAMANESTQREDQLESSNPQLNSSVSQKQQNAQSDFPLLTSDDFILPSVEPLLKEHMNNNHINKNNNTLSISSVPNKNNNNNGHTNSNNPSLNNDNHNNNNTSSKKQTKEYRASNGRDNNPPAQPSGGLSMPVVIPPSTSSSVNQNGYNNSGDDTGDDNRTSKEGFHLIYDNNDLSNQSLLHHMMRILSLIPF